MSNKCAEFRNNRLVHYRFVVHPHLLLKALDCRATTDDDDSSDDGFYKRDKKMSARRRGRMTEEKREPSHGDAASDGFDEVLDAKMPATQHGQATNGVRSKTSATDVLYENERQSSDESSLLSLSEKDDESNKRVASKPKPNKEPAGKLTRDYDPQVGDRVYAQWMPDEWYWGHVSGYKRNKSARQGYYSVSSLAFFFLLRTHPWLPS